jgi:hypothetical protein
VRYKNCTLTLENEPGITRKGRTGVVVTDGSGLLQLENVHLIYHGGPFPPAEFVAFVNCTFDVRLNETPPISGQSLVRGILTLGSDNFAVNISRHR